MGEIKALQVPTLASYLMVGSLVLIWGTTFLLVKFALEEASPTLVAAARVLIGGAALIPFAVLTGRKIPRGRGRWIGGVSIGVFALAVPMSLLAWAQQVVPSGVTGVYMAVIPLFVLPLAHIFSPGEAMTPRKLTGFLIGFVGVLVLMGWETLTAMGSANGLAQLACVGATLSYAIGSIMTRRTPETDPIALSALGFVIGGLLILPFAIGAWPDEPLSMRTWAIFLAIGVVSTGLAMILRVTIITSVGSVFMSGVGYLVPITALAVGVAFGGETLARSDLVACALILSGLAVASRRKSL